MLDPAKIAEHRDSIDRLTQLGFGALLAALQDPACYTKRGHVVLAAVARKLRVAPPQAAEMLLKAQQAVE